MALAFDGDRARLSGTCGIETAEPLLAWLLGRAGAQVDLSACRHLHAAVLQVLLAARPEVAGEPDDPFLARQVLPLLRRGRSGAQE